MDDAQDFEWNPIKASRVVQLCHMKEDKIPWQDTSKIDRNSGPKILRQIITFPSYYLYDTANPLKSYETHFYPQKGDHTGWGCKITITFAQLYVR